MKIRTGATIVLLLVLVAGAGCFTTSGGTEEPPSTLDLRLDDNQTDSGYRITGEVDTEILGAEREFDDVMVCLYDKDGVLLASETVGDVEPVTASSIDVTVPERPVYVIVDHPRFRDYEIGLRYVEWTGDVKRNRGGFPERDIDSFAYTPPNEEGTCGETD